MLVNSGLLQIIEILYKTLEWDLGSSVVYLQSVVTFDQVLMADVAVLLYIGLSREILSVTAVYTSGVWSGNCFIIFAALNLKTILLL